MILRFARSIWHISPDAICHTQMIFILILIPYWAKSCPIVAKRDVKVKIFRHHFFGPKMPQEVKMKKICQVKISQILPDFARYAKTGDMAISLNISQNGKIWRNLVADLKLLCNPKSQICVDLAGSGKTWHYLAESGKIWL